jgi:hypothetical protein
MIFFPTKRDTPITYKDPGGAVRQRFPGPPRSPLSSFGAFAKGTSRPAD